jgi:broad specificity phosphatase PhoE
MTRCLLTTSYVSKSLNIKPEVWTDIFEIKGCFKGNVGFPGKTRSEISELFPHYSLPDTVTDKGWYHSPGPEAIEDAWKRANSVLGKLHEMSKSDQYKGKTIAIVSHGEFIDFLLGNLAGQSMRKKLMFYSSNTGFSNFSLLNGDRRILGLNAVDHLQGVMKYISF